MRQTSILIPLFAFLTGCVTAAKNPDPSGPGGTGIARSQITVTAESKSRIVPNMGASPGFSRLTASIMSVDALANPNSDVTPNGPASLGSVPIASAGPGCEITGCRFTYPRVVIDGTLQGLMSVVTDDRGENTVWHTTYTTVVNANQIIDRARLGGPIDASAPAYVLAESALPALGRLLGTDANALVTRGLCLGLVWSTRGEAAGNGPGEGLGYGGARISLGATDGTAPSLYYLNDDMNLIVNSGTNQAGLFVLLGADTTQPGYVAPTSHFVPLTVLGATSAGMFANARAIVRPGVVTVVPIVPRR